MIEATYQEKRREMRLHERHPLRIQGIDITGNFFVEIVLTENISPSGVCVTLQREVAIGQHLQIFISNGMLQKQVPGATRWVLSSDGRWHVGIEFDRLAKQRKAF